MQPGICIPSGNSSCAASQGQLEALGGLSSPGLEALTGCVSAGLFFPAPLRPSPRHTCESRGSRTDSTPHLRTGLMHPASLHHHSANGTRAATCGSLRSRNTPARLLGNQIPQIIFPPALPHSVAARFQLTSMCLAGQLAAHARSEQHMCCLASWLLQLLPADVGLLPLVGMAICCFFFLHSAASLQVTRGNFVSL